MIELGSIVKDKISGFTGMVVACTKYLYGSTQFGVQETELVGGKPGEIFWFDISRLEIDEEETKVGYTY